MSKFYSDAISEHILQRAIWWVRQTKSLEEKEEFLRLKKEKKSFYDKGKRNEEYKTTKKLRKKGIKQKEIVSNRKYKKGW